MHIVQPLVQWVLQFSATSQFLALFLVILVEEAGVPLPVPDDALVALAGARSHMALPDAVAVLATATLRCSVVRRSSMYWFSVEGVLCWRGTESTSV